MLKLEKYSHRLHHSQLLKLKLSDIDQKEVTAVSGLPPLVAIGISIDCSEDVMVLLNDKTIVGILGIAPCVNPRINAREGSPWFLSDGGDWRFSKTFLMLSKGIYSHFSAAYPVMFNYVSVENQTSIRWLKHLGFSINTKTTYTFNGVDFYEFTKGR